MVHPESRWWRPQKTQAKTPCFRSTRYQIWTSKGCIEFYNNLDLPGVWCCVTPFFHLSPGFFTSADAEGACFRGTSSGGEVASFVGDGDGIPAVYFYRLWKAFWTWHQLKGPKDIHRFKKQNKGPRMWFISCFVKGSKFVAAVSLSNLSAKLMTFLTSFFFRRSFTSLTN